MDYYYIQKTKVQNMSVLKQKLDRAAQQFQIHNFKEALELYDDCLSFSYRTDQTKGVIYNIMTAKGALLCILGDIEKAMSTLNEVLRSDPNHYLALMRRSQVYKKKGKFNLALKDLQIISSYCPDNLQIAAMKIEIENQKNKNKNQNSSEESESEEDEEKLLNFSNLKKIDRKSCSIVVDKRKSRVTISGDTAFQYERDENQTQKSQVSTTISKAQAKEKYVNTFKQIESDDNLPVVKASNVVVKNTGRTKSILKNKAYTCSIMIQQQDKGERYGGRQSKLVDKLKNIDGKVLSSNHSLQSSAKEVQFRKSIYASQVRSEGVQIAIEKVKDNKKGPRKSCLKRCSFQTIEKEVKQRPIRKSKFEMMSRNSIDGIVIKNRKSIDCIKQTQDKNAKEEDSDEGSSYNIYGSGQQLVISKEVSDQLGLGKAKQKDQKKGEKQRGKSILKKNSILSKQLSVDFDKSEQLKEVSPAAKKTKKSVMFTKSRFADN